MTLHTVDTAKIFTTGRSQAVRLPKAFRFTTKEVTIERQGDAVIRANTQPRVDLRGGAGERRGKHGTQCLRLPRGFGQEESHRQTAQGADQNISTRDLLRIGGLEVLGGHGEYLLTAERRQK